jgi:hypothetical protein
MESSIGEFHLDLTLTMTNMTDALFESLPKLYEYCGMQCSTPMSSLCLLLLSLLSSKSRLLNTEVICQKRTLN